MLVIVSGEVCDNFSLFLRGNISEENLPDMILDFLKGKVEFLC
jgi:hypothetical protein